MTTRTYNPQMQKSKYPLPKWPQYSNQIRGARGALRRIEADLLKLEELCEQYGTSFDKDRLRETVVHLVTDINHKRGRSENSATYVPKRKA
jgi:hypothetical protein